MSEATATKTQQKTMSNLEQAILRSEMESVDHTALRLKKIDTKLGDLEYDIIKLKNSYSIAEFIRAEYGNLTVATAAFACVMAMCVGFVHWVYSEEDTLCQKGESGKQYILVMQTPDNGTAIQLPEGACVSKIKAKARKP